jgi:CheY-like chemotaxis protein
MYIERGSVDAPRVLIVCEDRHRLELLADQLRREFRVVATDDASRALEYLRRETVSLVITDQHMPHTPAVEQLAQASASSLQTMRVLMTGYSDVGAVLRAAATTATALQRRDAVLPICMECGKVKSAAAGWQGIARFLEDNVIPLSHGYCPGCAAAVKTRLGLDPANGS